MSLWQEIRRIKVWTSEEEGLLTRTRTTYRIGGRRSQCELTVLGRVLVEVGLRLAGILIERLLEPAHPEETKSIPSAGTTPALRRSP